MDGSGTAADPYHLRTVADFQILEGAGYSGYRGTTVYFSVENDIDFDGVTFSSIGNSTYTFSGQFYGNGHTISNLNITADYNNSGLFRVLTNRATVRDLKFKNCSITSTGSCVGMLAGRIYASQYVTVSRVETYNCALYTTNSAGSAGGIIGWGCYNGVADYNYRTLIYACSVIGGSIIAPVCAGGITGYGNYTNDEDRRNHQFQIANCHVARVYIRGDTASTNDYVGGIVANAGQWSSRSYIVDCLVESCAIVAAGYSAGGILGTAGYETKTDMLRCKVYDCLIYAVTRIAGGLVAYQQSASDTAVESCTVDCCTIRGGQQIGGLYGRLNEPTTEGAESNWAISNSSITHNYIGGSSATTVAVGGWVGNIKTGTASGTITGCTQDCNNVSGSLGTYGRNVDGYTNQVVNAAAYVTADSFSCSMLGRKVSFTFVNRRGCSMAYLTDSNTADTRFRYDTRGLGTYVQSWYLWYKYSASFAGNTYTPQIVLRCHGYTGATLTSTNSITVGTRHFISNHDQSFYQKVPDMSGISNHDQSYVRGEI